MNCPDCGAYVGDEDLFCGECGRPMAQAAPEALAPGDVKDEPTEVLPSPPPTRPALPQALRPEDVKDQPTEVLPSPPPARPVPPRPAAQPSAARLPNRGLLMGAAGVLAGLLCLCLAGVAIWLAVDRDEATPTPGALNPPPAGVLLYEDDFEDPESGWDVYNYGDTLALYQDGEYRLGIFRQDYVAWGNPEDVQDLGDFEIEVDSRAVEGPLDNNLGILVRYQEDDENFYWFQISSDGFFAIDRLAGGEWVSLAGWQESAAIQQGLGATNRLKVTCAGDQFAFYANDTWLATITDSDLGAGNIGLGAGSFDEPGVVVHFDNLRVYGQSK